MFELQDELARQEIFDDVRMIIRRIWVIRFVRYHLRLFSLSIENKLRSCV
jgi:hypothetical protein